MDPMRMLSDRKHCCTPWNWAVRILMAGLLAGSVAGCRPSDEAARTAGEALDARVPERVEAPATTLRMLDVGQGDAVLIQSRGKTALIDAGPSNDVVAQLRRLGVERLDLLLITHPHADHLGGADAVLEQIPVASYMDNGRAHTTQSYARVLEQVEAKGVRYLEATPRTLRLGSAALEILPPPGLESDNLNDHSIGVVVRQGGFEALLTGDSETEELHAWLNRGAVPEDVDVLKAAHHGSYNGTTPRWLAHTQPEVVLIGVGAENSYGHPHARALRYYRTRGRRIYRTDLHGDIVVRIAEDGDYAVTTEREAP